VEYLSEFDYESPTKSSDETSESEKNSPSVIDNAQDKWSSSTDEDSTSGGVKKIMK